jgi:hypothetical protein
MPFTFSHPAAILPFSYLPRKWVSMTGLVIGSLTPDFEYFIRMRNQSTFSHTIYGLFWFDLPLGLLLTFIFHNIVRNSLFNNLPTILKSRILINSRFDWNTYFKANWLVVTISILIGAASHILWDGFTHPHGYFVETIPALTNTFYLFGREIPIYKIVQHCSTLLGATVIAVVIFRFPKDKSTIGKFNVKYWGILTTIILTIIALRFLCGLDYKLYGNVIMTSISALLISLVLTPLLTGQKQ